MKPKRVLLLGTCGIGKKGVADRIKKWGEDHHSQDIRIVDFEHEYLVDEIQKPYRSFLNEARPVEQFEQWRKGWRAFSKSQGIQEFVDKRRDQPDTPELLLLHGSIVNGNYGVRAVYDVKGIAAYQPDLIISLIDDVYDTWWRTQLKAKGHPLSGRPTMEQLLLARRVEQLVGDQIANHLPQPPRHVVLSVHHPIECAVRLILGQPRIVYMAFPISEPRRMLCADSSEEGTTRGIDKVNDFHCQAFSFQKDYPEVVFISPIAIDELPFSKIVNGVMEGEKTQESGVRDEFREKAFRRDDLRWPTSEYWKEDAVLCPGRPEPTLVPVRQVADAAGMIRTDVVWRDYRLVLQADSLAVFNPVMNNRGALSGGVQNELEFASLTDKRIYAYQDEEEDKGKDDEQGFFKKEFIREDSSMGASPMTSNIELCESVQELLVKASAPEA